MFFQFFPWRCKYEGCQCGWVRITWLLYSMKFKGLITSYFIIITLTLNFESSIPRALGETLDFPLQHSIFRWTRKSFYRVAFGTLKMPKLFWFSLTTIFSRLIRLILILLFLLFCIFLNEKPPPYLWICLTNIYWESITHI